MLDFILHLDQHLIYLLQNYGTLLYVLIFIIIFAETGLVVTPFLPGDSLLFALGSVISFDSQNTINVYLMFVVLSIAAILGNISNYWIGRYLGDRVLNAKQSRWINPKHIEQTQVFYQKYGALAVILSRFAPLVRTFVPFVAGVGKMSFTRYCFYTIVGGVFWVGSFLFAGYFFGNLPQVKDHFHLLILGILVVSVLPALIGWFKMYRAKSKTI